MAKYIFLRIECPPGQFGLDCSQVCSGHCIHNEPVGLVSMVAGTVLSEQVVTNVISFTVILIIAFVYCLSIWFVKFFNRLRNL